MNQSDQKPDDDDAPVLQLCKRCGFTDELNAEGYCLLCSKTAQNREAP
jgi:hypothetical protein